jgi:hypothetical protein
MQNSEEEQVRYVFGSSNKNERQLVWSHLKKKTERLFRQIDGFEEIRTGKD